MPKVIVTNDRYAVDNPLYQWDLNEVLEIRGLSLASVPEIHFTNADMDRAIVRQASMDEAGIITADIPNSLLQKPLPVYAYVCIYEDETFETLYEIKIPLTMRKKPADYSFTDDQGEVYSFNAMENALVNALTEYEAKYDEAIGRVETVEESLGGKANASETTLSTLSAAGWIGSVYDFSVDYPDDQYNIEIALDSSASNEAISAYNNAILVGSATTNKVTAVGTVPTVNIPIILEVTRK